VIIEVEVLDPANLPIGGIQIVADQVVNIALHKFFLVGLLSITEPFRLVVVRRNHQFHFLPSSSELLHGITARL